MEPDNRTSVTLGRFINVTPRLVSLVSRPSSGLPFDTIIRAQSFDPDSESGEVLTLRSDNRAVEVYRFKGE